MTPIVVHGNAFSPEVLAITPIPVFNREAVQWLRADRKDAVEGAMRFDPKEKVWEHNGQGLDHAVKELKRLERDLEIASGTRRDILAIMVKQQRCTVQFWEGKIWLLDQMIAAAQKATL